MTRLIASVLFTTLGLYCRGSGSGRGGTQRPGADDLSREPRSAPGACPWT